MATEQAEQLAHHLEHCAECRLVIATMLTTPAASLPAVCLN